MKIKITTKISKSFVPNIKGCKNEEKYSEGYFEPPDNNF